MKLLLLKFLILVGGGSLIGSLVGWVMRCSGHG